MDPGSGGAQSLGGVPAACENSLPPIERAPQLLSELGLYADIDGKVVSDFVQEFAPRFHLWSDGAKKTRWLYLPECERIDTSVWDHWSFPVGTRAFKQFVVNEKLIETRLVHRFGPGKDDFLFAHYLWDESESEATLIDENTPLSSLEHPQDTDYFVPPPATCPHCHGDTGKTQGGLPSRFLGPSAVQLSHDGPGLTLSWLRDNERLTHPREDYQVPGKETTQAALGYLHANCGFCHNQTEDGVPFPFEPMTLLLETKADNLYETGVYSTAVGHAVLGYSGACTDRVSPRDPSASCIVERMNTRVEEDQMPPIDTHLVDTQGLALVREWISGM